LYFRLKLGENTKIPGCPEKAVKTRRSPGKPGGMSSLDILLHNACKNADKASQVLKILRKENSAKKIILQASVNPRT
jgi:hypothetical protein